MQIYFHLNELPQAVWLAVSSSLSTAEKAAATCFNPKMMQRIRDVAMSEAKAALETEQVDIVGSSSVGSGGPTSALRKKKQSEQQLERLMKKKLKEQRAELASQWANAVGEATLQIATLQRVLAMKSDPVSRQNFLQVVASSGEVPEQFVSAQLYLEQFVYGSTSRGNRSSSKQLHILNLFWTQMCLSLGNRFSRLLKYENGKLVEEVAALYPALRASSLSMLSTMGEDSDKTRRISGDEDGMRGAGGIGVGILGGSSLLEDDFGVFRTLKEADETGDSSGRGAFAGISADSWTCDSSPGDKGDTDTGNNANQISTSSAAFGGSSSSSLHRFEWKVLVGEYGGRRNSSQTFETIGLSALQAAFLETSNERLCAPLPYFFSHDHSLIGMDVAGAEGVAGIAVLATLPSRNDLANIESLVREHLSLADPRQGGGELGMVTILCDTINDMVVQFLAAAQEATSGAAEAGGDTSVSAAEIEDEYLYGEDWSATEALAHDVKLAGIIVSTA